MAAEIFQSKNSGGPWVSVYTSAKAAAITTTDISTKRLSSLNGGRKIENPGSLNRKSYGPVGGFIEDQFKLLWNHSPNGGRYYKVRIYKGKNHGAQGDSGTFGYKLFYPTDSTVNATTPVNGFTPTVNYNLKYNGTFVPISESIDTEPRFNEPRFNVESMLNNPNIGQVAINTNTITAGASNPVVSEQIFNVVVTGLKTNTIHKFFFEGLDTTSKTKQTGGVLGGGLKSDANGRIEFTFYYHPDIEATTSVSQSAADIEKAAGVKSIRVASNDNTSYAESTLQIQQYVSEVIETPPPPPTAITPPATSTTQTIAGGGRSNRVKMNAH